MICSLLVLALASVQFQVDGLHPNETWTAVAPGPSPYELDADGVWVFRGGRVVDAMTNRPIAGAKIELWTEEIDEYFGGFHQIGAAESAHDGGFIIRQREAGRHAGKMRVSAAGYSTLSAAAGEVGTEIQLYPMTPPVEVFFVDTMRRAIPNVQVTSTFTCSHDLPAYHLVSDAHGRVVLSQSGWQRDIPEMRILPPGYGAIEYFSPDKFLMPQEGDPRFEIVLPKMPTASIRILRRDGSVDSFRSFFVNEGECYHVLTSDEHGVIALPTRFGTRSASIRPLEPNYDFSESVRIDLAAALGTPLTVRPDQDWEEDVDTGALVLQCESELALSRSFGLRVWHEDGWTAYWPRHEDANTTTLELPVGKGHVVYGSHFGENAFEVIPFEIKAGEPKTITIEPTTQPAITIEWPEETEAWWVEVGAVSTPGQSRDQPMHVPAGEPIAVRFRTRVPTSRAHGPPIHRGLPSRRQPE